MRSLHYTEPGLKIYIFQEKDSENIQPKDLAFIVGLFLSYLGLVSFCPETKRPFWWRWGGKGALQLIKCDFRRGMLGWALLHLWQRNSMDNSFSSSFRVAFPKLPTSSITSTESRKYSVLKVFQCFLFFRCFESKSWLITCRCSCLIDGICKAAYNISWGI